jgi:tetratricopeptide (TPR) repeat protein
VTREFAIEGAVRRFNSLIVIGLSAYLTAGSALAQTAAELFAEGNALVRSGVYRTALLRYREAAAAGFDTPLLHYNVGVVYYELDEFAAAAEEFARAAGAPELTALASYNRGLAQRAAGDHAGAALSFQAAADSADDRDLRRLATSAAEAPLPTADTAAARPTRREPRATVEPEGRVGEFRLLAAARLGQDDNVYETPADPYVDLSDATQPVVTPVVRSGSFMPVELHAAYALGNETGDTDFNFRYDLDGDFYATELANATVVDQRILMGADIVLGERERRSRLLDTAFFMRTHRETNFNPDDGLARDINGEDISDRFSYKAAGVRGEFAHRLGDWSWGFDITAERREYERTTAVANYDHDYFYAAVDIARDLSDVMTLRGTLLNYRRVYDTRPARDLTGALIDTNPAQEYGYMGLEVGVVRELGRAIELSADYLRLERVDEFLGYNDFTEDGLRLRATFRPSTRFDLSLGAIARTYNYPRAFAYNVAAGGPLELEELAAELALEFRLTQRLTMFGELTMLDTTSTDARAAYARSRAMLGVEWRR